VAAGALGVLAFQLQPQFLARRGPTATGWRASSTAIIVKKQLFTWRTSWVRMFSASTLMPISIDVRPV
jgi:hypothetical protein